MMRRDEVTPGVRLLTCPDSPKLVTEVNSAPGMGTGPLGAFSNTIRAAHANAATMTARERGRNRELGVAAIS